MSKLIWIVVIVAIVIGGVWYFTNKSSSPIEPSVQIMPPVTETPAEGTTTSGTSVGVGASLGTVKEFTVTGSDFSFAPSTMTVNRGDAVRIIFKNVDGTHDFKIDEFGIATKKIGTGESEVIEFVAGSAGTFEYYCSVGQHRAMGMKGTLVVK